MIPLAGPPIDGLHGIEAILLKLPTNINVLLLSLAAAKAASTPAWRTTLFDSPEQNRNSEQWADTYDLASLSVNTIDAVNSVQEISKFVQKLNDQGIHNVFQSRAFLNKEVKPDFKEFFVGIKANGEILKNGCRLTPYDQIVAKQKEMVPIRLFKNANQVNKALNQTFVGIENMIHTNDIRGLGKGVLEFTREKIPLWDYIHESRGQIKDVFA